MKKIVIVSIFAFALAVTPAFAAMTFNNAFLMNNTTSGANTGANSTSGFFFAGSSTGNAYSAAGTINAVNNNVGGGGFSFTKNNAFVSNQTTSSANTGSNKTFGATAVSSTGNAYSKAGTVNLVNTNIKF